MALQLRYSPISPFVRKVMVFAHEAGLADSIALVPTDVWHAESDIGSVNPLGKVPVLLSNDGTFAGSALCCEYLDTLHNGSRLIPAAPRDRWPVLQLHAIADGAIEAAVAHVVERLRRPKDFVFQNSLDRQAAKIDRALDAFEKQEPVIREKINLATITLGCALGYLDFRMPQTQWRNGHPALTDWYSEFSERNSMVATKPKA